MNDIHDLVGVDLNLFVAFDALARERSVTLAARRLGVTQSAMSHTLRRLRELLGDPLLVRGQGGMVLTPRAEALVVPLRSSLVALGRTLTESTQFDPKTAERTFRLATPDLFDVLAIPPLLHRIRKEAPNVDLHVVPVQRRRLADELETGDVDLAGEAEVVYGSRITGPDKPGSLKFYLGGKLVTPPTPVAGIRVALFEDPEGNVVGLSTP